MAMDGSSVAIQVGTAVKFPLASNQGQALCLFCEILMAVVLFLQRGVMLLPEHVPAHCECKWVSVHVFCTLLLPGCRVFLGGYFIYSKDAFSASSNTAQVKSCGVAVDAMNFLPTNLFLLPMASM